MIIHDLDKDQASKAFASVKDHWIIDQWEPIHPCVGCFGCWVKTPGACVIRDGYGNMGELLGKTEQLIIVSRCVYGGYSPFVKNILDRSISYINPDFCFRNGEMHHCRRYPNEIKMSVYFYGGITDKERKTALSMVTGNGLNFDAKVETVNFSSLEELMEGIKCAG